MKVHDFVRVGESWYIIDIISDPKNNADLDEAQYTLTTPDRKGARRVKASEIDRHVPVESIHEMLSENRSAGVSTLNPERDGVMQEWTYDLTLMQQSVLMAAVRGPDGLPKEHPSKPINRWLRRSFLLSAFDRVVLERPQWPGGGSFTGPSIVFDACDTGRKNNLRDIPDQEIWERICAVAKEFLNHVDELPHHYLMHIVHAAEILGYKHPDEFHRNFWNQFYTNLVKGFHMEPESELEMDTRLSDNRAEWLKRDVLQ